MFLLVRTKGDLKAVTLTPDKGQQTGDSQGRLLRRQWNAPGEVFKKTAPPVSWLRPKALKPHEAQEFHCWICHGCHAEAVWHEANVQCPCIRPATGIKVKGLHLFGWFLWVTHNPTVVQHVFVV